MSYERLLLWRSAVPASPYTRFWSVLEPRGTPFPSIPFPISMIVARWLVSIARYTGEPMIGLLHYDAYARCSDLADPPVVVVEKLLQPRHLTLGRELAQPRGILADERLNQPEQEAGPLLPPSPTSGACCIPDPLNVELQLICCHKLTLVGAPQLWAQPRATKCAPRAR